TKRPSSWRRPCGCDRDCPRPTTTSATSGGSRAGRRRPKPTTAAPWNPVRPLRGAGQGQGRQGDPGVPAAPEGAAVDVRGCGRGRRRGEGLPAFDVQVPLMSLPGLLGVTLEDTVAAVPYLKADEARVEAWRSRLAQVEGFRVGVVWQGNPRFQWDR